MRLLSRCLLGATAIALAGVVSGPARAGEKGATAPSAEGWYPVGVGAVMAPLYPEDTLHVGVVAGQESDRTYLRFDLAVPFDADVDRVTLTVPIAADAGTSAPEDAVIRACAVPGGFAGGEDSAPEVDCDAGSDAAFVAGNVPLFMVDVSSLEVDGVVELALVPAGGDAWHVGFDSTSRADGAPATVVATFGDDSDAAAGASPSVSARPSSTPPATFVAPSSPVPARPSAPGAPVAVGDAIAGAADRPISTAPTFMTDGAGFRYPAIFALPLVLLVAIAIAADGLTRPVRLREDAA